jgi:PAS domain S-box-containing protein
MKENNFKMAQFDEAVLEEKATWWQMELPSGKVIFGDAKAKMLGYPSNKFKTYSDFTNLVHPEDYEKTMEAMKDHLSGKKQFYETLYRIKNKNGEYIMFYDCGQIIKKEGEKIIVMGFVMKVENEKKIFEKMKEFKELITEGKPSIVELVSKIK